MAMINSLGAQDPDQGQSASTGPSLHPLVTGMGALHDLSRARFDKLSEAKSMLDKVRLELTPLAKMGDLVAQDDIIKAAGKLVGHGLGAAAVAGLLADMPPDGQALGAWVAQHMQGVAQREAQLMPVLAQAQHQLGVHALQLLAAHHMAGAQQPAPMPEPPPEAPVGEANVLGAAPSGTAATGGPNAG